MLLIGIDPGVTTGVCALNLEKEFFELDGTWQLGNPDAVYEDLEDLIAGYELVYGEEDVLVLCESFEIRPDVIDPDETPKYIIKDLDRYVAPQRGERFKYRMASQAKTGVPPARNGRQDRLKAFGLYQTGQRHANDAIRHCVSYALDKLHYAPLIKAGWGAPGKK